jgi:hypothetical protein
VSHYERSTTTDKEGNFTFTNVPFNPYHLVVTASGFVPFTQDGDVRSLVASAVTANLKVTSASETVNVTEQAGELVGE